MEEVESPITDIMVLEYSGETELCDVRELVIRGEGVTGFDVALDPSSSTSKAKPTSVSWKLCALSQLEVLSLSNNNIASLTSKSPVFPRLPNLIQLNLNFNPEIADLSVMRSPLLRELFLSNCSFDNDAVATLPRLFPKLEKLCLYRNQITNLSNALDCFRRLSELKCLDLGGNPCAAADSYKHEAIRLLGEQLERLDGDRVEALDIELSKKYFNNGKVATQSLCIDSKKNKSENKKEQAPKSNKQSETKLFTSSFLNNNPVMLDYLARGVIAHPGQDTREYRLVKNKINSGTGATSRSSSTTAMPTTEERGFVGKIRKGTAARRKELLSEEEKSKEIETETAIAIARSIAETKSMNEAAVAAEADDPAETIRRLLHAIEILQEERAMYLKRERDFYDNDQVVNSDVSKLSEENERLSAENANMYDLLEVNKVLRVKLEAAELRAKNYKEKTSKNSLFAENMRLKKEIETLKNKLEIAEMEAELGSRKSNRPKTAAQLIEECENEVSRELAELLEGSSASRLLRNESGSGSSDDDGDRHASAIGFGDTNNPYLQQIRKKKRDK
eukprot:g4707.t1